MNNEITLNNSKVTLGTNFLTVAPDATEQEIKSAFHTLAKAEDASMFWLGDILAASEARYGDKYTDALASTNYKEKTLKTAKSVCSRIPAAQRTSLTFTHHRDAINTAKGDLQTALKYLGIAEREHLPVSQMRKMMRLELNPPTDNDKVTIFFDKELATALSALDTLEFYLARADSHTLAIQKTIFVSRLETLLDLANKI